MNNLLKKLINSLTRIFTKKSPSVLYVKIKKSLEIKDIQKSNRSFRD